MKNIIPVSDLQRQAASILQEVNDTQKPVVITQRGRASAVLLSAKHYQRIEEELEKLDELVLLREVELGRAELRAGNSISQEEAKKRLGFTG